MAQQTTGDFDITASSTSGTELAAILNRMNAALQTAHSGSIAPSYALNATLWLDTTSSVTHILKYYNSTNTTWTEILSVTTATGAITFAADAQLDLKADLTGDTFSGLVDFQNNIRIIKTTSVESSLKLYNNTGGLKFHQSLSGSGAISQTDSAGAYVNDFIQFTMGGGSTLFNNGTPVLQILSAGITTAGIATSTQVAFTSSDSSRTTDTTFYSSVDNTIRKNNDAGFRASLGVDSRETLDTNGLVPSAWCVFDGTTIGTNAPIAGYNVDDVTRLAAGAYTVNLTTALDNANVMVLASTNFNNSIDNSMTNSHVDNFNQATLDAVTVTSHSTAGVTRLDSLRMYVAVFGGKA